MFVLELLLVFLMFPALAAKANIVFLICVLVFSRVLHSDMPLYMKCPCGGGRGGGGGGGGGGLGPAQLARLHVVTPKAPLHVVLNPRVRARPDGPVFHPGWGPGGSAAPKKLPHNAVIVLRMPFIYQGKYLYLSAITVFKK